MDPKIPRYGFLKHIGKVRILEYRGNGTFVVLDRQDQKRYVTREQLKFQRWKK